MNKVIIIAVRLDEQLAKKLDDLAEKTHRDRSKVMRCLIENARLTGKADTEVRDDRDA